MRRLWGFGLRLRPLFIRVNCVYVGSRDGDKGLIEEDHVQ